MPLDVSGLRRLFIPRLDNIGDVVMLGPAVRALREALPTAHITLMLSPAGSRAAPLLPWADEIMTERVVWQDAFGAMPLDARRELGLVRRLRARRFDAALIFTSFSQSPWPCAYACYLAGIRVRVAQSEEFGGSLLTHWVRPLPDSVHQVDRNLHLLSALGIPAASRHLELRLPAQATHVARRLLDELGIDGPYIALGLGASCSARRYDPHRFGQVAQGVTDASGLPVVLLGSAAEGGLADALQAVARRKSVVSLVGRTSVPEMAALVADAALVITNNSAPMHIADAFGRPSIVLFSGTELERQWRPRNSAARLLRRPTGCSPCYGFTCPHNQECLDMPPQTVVDAALRLFAESGAAEQAHARARQGGSRCASYAS